MRTALINSTYGDMFESLDVMISRYFHPRELAKAFSKNLGDTTWVQGYRDEGNHRIDSIDLTLFRANPFTGGEHAVMSQHVDTHSLARVIDDIKPDFVHILGILPMDILQIAEISAKYTNKLSASFHGGGPSSDPSFFELQKHAMQKLSAVFFNSPERAKIWQDAGLITPPIKLGICPETSSFFTMQDRKQVRSRTQMHGNPVCVASARLHPIKDPITMLKGFEQILSTKPDARLYWAFQTDELRTEINEMLNASTLLKNAVHLRGSIDKYEDMEDFFNSADFFIQASLDEYGGNSLVEAMACGTIPVVTDIPSFRYLTSGNRFDTLFDKGDSAGLAQIINKIPKEQYTEYSRRIRNYFDERLSFDSIAKTITNVMS